MTAETEQGIRDAIAAHIKAEDGVEAMVVHYVVVAEVISGDQPDPWLKTASDDAITPWARVGMAEAIRQISHHTLQQGWEPDE